MPDKDGSLTDAEKQQIETWLKEHWKSWACPFSGDTNWTLGDFLVHTPKFGHRRGIDSPTPSVPSAIVVCSGCGYQVFINAVMVGLLPRIHGYGEEEIDV